MGDRADSPESANFDTGRDFRQDESVNSNHKKKNNNSNNKTSTKGSNNNNDRLKPTLTIPSNTTTARNTDQYLPSSIDKEPKAPILSPISRTRTPIQGIRRFTRKNRKVNRAIAVTEQWENYTRKVYHEYIHSLVLSGWDNLTPLDEYMCHPTSAASCPLTVSVVDFTDDHTLKYYNDLCGEDDLDAFMQSTETKRDGKVRLYLVEQGGQLSPGVIEVLGRNLSCDPRFFCWNVFGSGQLMDPAERHRALFTSIGFTIQKPSDDGSEYSVQDTEFFRISIYIIPDDENNQEPANGWTAVIIFNQHTPITLSTRIFIPPPKFGTSLPSPPVTPLTCAQSFRQLYLTTLPTLPVATAVLSPFYMVTPLFQLCFHCWNTVIWNVREADKRVGGISTASVGHTEEIQKTMSLLERYGSLGWKTDDRVKMVVAEKRTMLIEDFKHLLSQTELLWDARRKWKAILDKRKDSKTSALTNSFTYMYVPSCFLASSPSYLR